MTETRSYSELAEDNMKLRAHVTELESSVQQLAAAGVTQAMVAQIYGVPYHEVFWHTRPLGQGALHPPAAVLV